MVNTGDLVRCGDPAPDDTYVMLECDYCEGEELFPHKGRGRRPKMCPWGREEFNLQEAEDRENRRAESKGVRVPTFELFDPSRAKTGTTVYHLIKDTPLMRKYAREFKVKKITDLYMDIISTKKTHYRNYPMRIEFDSGNMNKLYAKTGYEYVDIDPEEENGVDGDE